MKKSVLVSLPGFLLACLFATTHAAEEQIVIEDLSRAELRDEIKKIQTEYYRVFNTLNIDDKMDIICYDYLPTGSNIGKEACEPQFVIDRRGENAADWQQLRDQLLSPEALLSDLAVEFQALTDEINAVEKKNLYFKELNTILRALRESLEEFSI